MLYILLALFSYTGTVLVATYASRHLDIILVTAIENVVTVVIPVILAIPILQHQSAPAHRNGIIAAITAGLLLTLFTLAINKSYAQNKVGIVLPIILGGSIFLSTLLSYFLFKEKVSFLQSVGLFFLGVGFVIITYARWVGK